MKSATIKTYSLSIALGVLVGCSSATPILDQHWGQSYEAARYSQTLNPEPAGVTSPVEGMGAERSVIIEERYNESFGKPQQRPIYYINMPGVTSNR